MVTKVSVLIYTIVTPVSTPLAFIYRCKVETVLLLSPGSCLPLSAAEARKKKKKEDNFLPVQLLATVKRQSSGLRLLYDIYHTRVSLVDYSCLGAAYHSRARVSGFLI